MGRMHVLRAITAVGLTVAVGAAGAVAGNATSEGDDTRDLSIFIRDTNQVTSDLGEKGPGHGDVFTYHGPVLTKKGGKQIGRFGGGCTTLGQSSAVPEDSTCTLDYVLPKGQLFTQVIGTSAHLFSGKPFDFAILGGTGAYRGAGGDGTMRVPADVPDQTDAYAVFRIR